MCEHLLTYLYFRRKQLNNNCSLFNAMIKDNGNGTHQMLIDWEFVMEILKNLKESELYYWGALSVFFELVAK